MKKLISLLIIVIMLVSVSFSAVANAQEDGWFTDVPTNKWYYNSIKFVFDAGLMVGTTDIEFSPNANFSRAMLVTVLWRLQGEPSSNVNYFGDVANGKWFTKAVSWAAMNGIVSGFGDGSFKPNDPVTREQMTSIFMRYAEYLGLDTSAREDINTFADASKVGSWAKTSMKWAIASRLIFGFGKNNLDPKGNATRAQSAAILERFVYEVLLNPELWPEGEDDFGGDYENLPTTPYEYDDDYRITETVKNDNGIIPDELQGLSKDKRYASEETKYDFDKNPLINRDHEANMNTLPSFDIDSTGFVRAGTKLSDLKGKTLKFFTADTFPAWSYRNSRGQTIDEWQWFKELKDELGLTIKYTMKQHVKSSDAVLQAMTAGLQCDIVYSNHSNLCPQSLNLSKPLTDVANLNNLGKSPGVCKSAMELTRWGSKPRLVSPIGVVDVLWYNQTLTQELGLSDPHVMWENGEWDWDSFKKYMLSIPRQDKYGRELVAWTCFPTNMYFTWDTTNGVAQTSIVTNAKVPTVVNNWTNPKVLEAWEFICGVNSMVNYRCGEDNYGLGVIPEHIGLYEGTTIMSATMYTQVYRDTEYSKHVQINWVPFPKSTTKTGQETAQLYGFGLLLPRETVLPQNESVALKFMELWATRFTEAYFDNLGVFEYYNFNYEQRKQYFNFVTRNLVYSPAMSNVHQYGYMLHAFLGYGQFSVSNEAVKYAQRQMQDIASTMAYGY